MRIRFTPFVNKTQKQASLTEGEAPDRRDRTNTKQGGRTQASQKPNNPYTKRTFALAQQKNKRDKFIYVKK